jgi:hypothetical protein
MSITPRQLEVLHMTASDVVLLIKRRGSDGSSDCRPVRRDLVMRLRREGFLEHTISHGDMSADGFRLTETGKRYVEQHPLR